MTEPNSTSPDPFEGLDPEVWQILAAQQAAQQAGQPGGGQQPGAPGSAQAGGPAGTGAPGPAASGSTGDPDAAPGRVAGWRRRHRGPAAAGARNRRSAWGATIAFAVLVVVAALLDRSGLAAPVAWSGASPSLEPWTWLQYVLLAPLMVLLLSWWAHRLLGGATPAAPRVWVLTRTWLLVVLAMMTAKLVYSVLLMAPYLLDGADGGLPAATSLPYLVWATGFTGIKAGSLGWIPGLVAAILWTPGGARRSGIPSKVLEPSLALLPAALVALCLALVGGWTSRHWWTGSPVGYAHTTDWRLLAPTAASGRVAEIAALVLLWLALSGSLRATLRRVQPPRAGFVQALAGALAALVAGVSLAGVQSVVAAVFGTDVPGGDDLWIIPSTYLRLAEGLSFGLLVAPVAALAAWLVPRAPRPQWSWIAAVAAVAVLVGAGVLVTRGAPDGTGVPPLAGPDPAPVELPPQPAAEAGVLAAPGRLTVRRDADGSAVLADQSGAQVILRGINVNQLGEYWAANADVPTVVPLEEQDFVDLAALGFNAVRLVLSWSALAPEPGVVDAAYLDRVRQAVGWARTHGIHVVLDVHQDAWSAGVAAPAGTACRSGTSPMIGWDGAPEWASHYDGAPPCQFTGRDLAPNVLRAFTSFYTDRDEVETQLVEVWGRLAKEFGGDPTIAGYDLLNEPSFAEQAPLTSAMLLGRYHARAIQAIRAGESGAPSGYAHPVFLEPSIWWSGFGVDPLPPRGFTTDSQLVFSPHLYNESITMDQSLGLTFVGIERGYALAQRAADGWGVPLWSGEWGSFSDSQTNLARYERFVAAEDALRVGSAVWVWKQGCGDPHVYPSEEAGNIRRVSCPDGAPLPSNAAELQPLTRSYPRSAPGRLVAVRADGRALQLEGDVSGVGRTDGTPDSCRLDVWVPGAAEPKVAESTGVTDLRAVSVPEGSLEQAPSGGWRVIGCATGNYTLTVQ